MDFIFSIPQPPPAFIFSIPDPPVAFSFSIPNTVIGGGDDLGEITTVTANATIITS